MPYVPNSDAQNAPVVTDLADLVRCYQKASGDICCPDPKDPIVMNFCPVTDLLSKEEFLLLLSLSETEYSFEIQSNNISFSFVYNSPFSLGHKGHNFYDAVQYLSARTLEGDIPAQEERDELSAFVADLLDESISECSLVPNSWRNFGLTVLREFRAYSMPELDEYGREGVLRRVIPALVAEIHLMTTKANALVNSYSRMPNRTDI